MIGNEETRDHSAEAREIRVKAAERALSEARAKHASQFLTIIMLMLVVMAVQALAQMTLAKRLTVVVMPSEVERRQRTSVSEASTQTLLFRGGSAECGNPGKTPAAAGDFIHGGRERGSL